MQSPSAGSANFDRRISSCEDTNNANNNRNKKYTMANVEDDRNNFESNYQQGPHFTGKRSIHSDDVSTVIPRIIIIDFRDFRDRKESREAEKIENKEKTIIINTIITISTIVIIKKNLSGSVKAPLHNTKQ
ncbi:hypothetical protein EVAR_71322_1 [Eumeta japonica]|uniref:Uncharacterized protein n=1 Tax=Eumeta variegata TaxID=151549 RepID=A0A4C1TBP1_EUMVA|nr:hypothetical protein EVAR_71322_1 [Eumeta japonica]